MIMVDETLAMEKVKTFQIAKWTLSQEIQIKKIDMGIIKDSKYLKLNVNLKEMVATIEKELLREFTNLGSLGITRN
jgi:predicted transport protein